MKPYENLNHTQNCMPVGRVLLVSLSLLYVVAMCACFLLLLGKSSQPFYTLVNIPS